jgi:hypothetical protein
MKGMGMAKNVGGVGKMQKGYGIGKMNQSDMEDENKKNMVKSNELLSKLSKK